MQRVTEAHVQAMVLAFEKVYGEGRMASFTGQDAAGLVRLWAGQLVHYPLYRLEWAMRNLPPHPPSLPALRALLAEAPAQADPDTLRLPHKASPESPQGLGQRNLRAITSWLLAMRRGLVGAAERPRFDADGELLEPERFSADGALLVAGEPVAVPAGSNVVNLFAAGLRR